MKLLRKQGDRRKQLDNRLRNKKFALVVDPEPKFDLSPYLYMQFMEPLGTTDSSVEAGWDFMRNCWREDLIEVTRELAPTIIRWPGGCLASYYRWREGVGPRDKRIPMYNLCWGGIETNQIGTHEFMDFCRQVNADPLITVNFRSDGRKYWAKPVVGGNRSADSEEAAEWIDYCNNPSNKERIQNGSKEPFGVKTWQIGNETSYARDAFDCETSAKLTREFAREMHKADPDIALIGWGDSGWARKVAEIAGEELEYIAFHHHFNSGMDNSPLKSVDYREDPELTWEHLMNAYKSSETRIHQIRDEVKDYNIKLAITEGHFALPGRNRCEVLSSWGAGVANARVLNVHARNGDIIKIATLADFCGNRWMVNAIMIPTPGGKSYMMPVARVMSLFRHHTGRKALDVLSIPDGLDITASRSDDKIYLHVINTKMKMAIAADIQIKGTKINSGQVFEITADPTDEIDETRPDLFSPVQHNMTDGSIWQFPAASVTALELEIENLE
ncbi:alpha-L-arabinofuranosidase [Candidatus Poribacteria bacterium]|nr:alpha-L-arabinofuranosidase [Candidatus Poribacteria bacterium]